MHLALFLLPHPGVSNCGFKPPTLPSTRQSSWICTSSSFNKNTLKCTAWDYIICLSNTNYIFPCLFTSSSCSLSQPLSTRSAFLLLIYLSCQLEALFPSQDFAMPLSLLHTNPHSYCLFIQSPVMIRNIRRFQESTFLCSRF